MESRIIALSYNFSLDYPLNFQPRRFGTVAVSVEAVPKVPTLRVRKPAVCDWFSMRLFRSLYTYILGSKKWKYKQKAMTQS